MKKLLLLAAMVLGLASCQTEPEGFDVNVGGEQDVNITVSLPEGTRANSAEGAFENVDFTKYDVRFQCEVHYGPEKKVLEPQFSDNGKEASFNVRLIANRNYTFVVWADLVEQGSEADLHYNTANGLTNITLNDTWVAMDETRDAFTCSEVREFKRNANINLELKRPFAKLRVITTDMKELMGVVPAKVKVEYTTTHFDTYNALTKTPSGELRKDHVERAIPAYGYEDGDAEKTLFTDYFFATEAQNVVNFDMYVYDQNNDIIDGVKSFNTPIPTQRNYVTTIKGNILTYAEDFSVEILPGFSNADNLEGEPFYVEVISGEQTETVELAEGTYLFGDVTFNVEGEPAIVAKSGDVVIDIMNSMTINGVNGIVVEEGATLTINGLAETRSSNRGGSLVIKATNGSAIAGKYITINNLASLTAIGNGNHAFGIGGTDAEVTINNTKIDYVAGGHVQALFVNDTKYGKSEPEGGAAIGGEKVVIENSEIVKAEGGSKAAAIGNSYWNSTEVVIKNSQFGDIFGGNASAAIGGSRYNNESKHNIKILIENSTITNAVGGEAGAGIGSGYDTHCNQQNYTAVNNIVIKNSNITAKGGKYSPGIGAGYHSAYLTGSIDAESTINSTAGDLTFYKEAYTIAQNLGYGVMDPTREFSGDNINITFTVAGKVIAAPTFKVTEGVSKDLAGNYYISNAEGLAWVSENVNTMELYVSGSANIFDNVTVYLANDIDLGGAEWRPIGDYAFSRTSFNGVFDGQGYTVSNFKVTEPVRWTDKVTEASYGFFGNVKGTVKNLTIKNATVNPEGGRYSAALVGRLHNGGRIENCHVENSTVTILHWQVGGIVGQNNNGNIYNCSVVGSTITGKAAVGAIVGMDMTAGEHTIENCSIANTALVQNESFGASYDASYGLAVGLVNASGIVLNINDIVAEDNTIKGVADNTLVGDKEEGAVIKLNGVTAVSTAAELEAAIKAGGNYALANDIAMTAALAISNANFTLDGNGKTITMAEGATNNIALFDITGGKATFKNVTFDSIQKGAVVRTVGAEFVVDNVTVQNCNHTVDQGLFRLFGESTITNSTFKNNTCKMVVSFCFDHDTDTMGTCIYTLNINGCEFAENTCSTTAVCYYANGSAATLNGNKFVNNALTVSNGATVYLGFKKNCTVTNNLFDGNTVTATSKRSAGGLMVGNAAVVTGNAFVNNTLTVNGETGYGNDVCASVYYSNIDLSGNYWGGNAPVANDDYYQEYSNNSVIINNYLTVNPFN